MKIFGVEITFKRVKPPSNQNLLEWIQGIGEVVSQNSNAINELQKQVNRVERNHYNLKNRLEGNGIQEEEAEEAASQKRPPFAIQAGEDISEYLGKGGVW